MRAPPSTTPLALCLGLGVGAPAAHAEGPIWVQAQTMFYADNTEFFDAFRTGETTFGIHGRAFLSARPSEKVELRLGLFGNQRFGSDKAFESARPVFALVIGGPRRALVLGTLETGRRADGPGPDRTTPHGLLPPIQVETLTFTRPYEAGLQSRVASDRVRNDLWIDWQTLIASGRREVFDTGSAGRVRVAGPFSLGVQLHEVHHGGQLTDVGSVSDSFAWGAGLVLEPKLPSLDHVSAEVFGLRSDHHPVRSRPETKKRGHGVFVRLAAEKRGFRLHGILWRGVAYLKEEGDPLYRSQLEDGTPFEPTRRYEELGLTKLFPVMPGVAFEASARLNWVQGKREYSYRVLATTDLGWAVRR